MKKLLIIILMIFIFSGCESHKETNDLGIVSALGFEKINDEYIVSAQVISTKSANNQTSNNNSKVVVFSNTGKTIFEAIRSITTKTSKKLYFPHTRIVIVDDDLLNDDPNDVIDFLARDSESMLNFYILVTTNDSPKDILETLTPLEDISAEYVSASLLLSEQNYGNTVANTFEKFISDFLTDGISPTFTKVSLTKNSDKKDENKMLEKTALDTYIQLGNVLVFNKSGILEELFYEESIALNFAKNTIQNALLTLKCPTEEYFYTVEIINQKTNMEFIEKISEVKLNTDLTVTLADYRCKENITKKENIKKLQKDIKEFMEKNMNDLLDKSVYFENDFIGIGKFVISKNKKYFEKYKNSWNNEGLKSLNLVSDIKVSIQERGNLSNNTVKESNNEK